MNSLIQSPPKQNLNSSLSLFNDISEPSNHFNHKKNEMEAENKNFLQKINKIESPLKNEEDIEERSKSFLEKKSISVKQQQKSKTAKKNELDSENQEIKASEGEGVSGRWTKEEHSKFVKAICQFGNEWKKVQQFIPSRSSTQARSHAQKFFIRMQSKLNLSKIGSETALNELRKLPEELLIMKIKEYANIDFDISSQERDKLIEVLLNFSKLNKKEISNINAVVEDVDENKDKLKPSFDTNYLVQSLRDDICVSNNEIKNNFVNESEESRKLFFQIEKNEKNDFLMKKMKSECNASCNSGRKDFFDFINKNPNEGLNSETIKSDLMTEESINPNQLKDVHQEVIQINDFKNFSSEKISKEKKLKVNRIVKKSSKMLKTRLKESRVKQMVDQVNQSKLNDQNLCQMSYLKLMQNSISAQDMSIYVNNYSLNQGPYPFNINLFISPTMQEYYCKIEEETIINPFIINFPMEDVKEEENLNFEDFNHMYN